MEIGRNNYSYFTDRNRDSEGLISFPKTYYQYVLESNPMTLQPMLSRPSCCHQCHSGAHGGGNKADQYSDGFPLESSSLPARPLPWPAATAVRETWRKATGWPSCLQPLPAPTHAVNTARLIT